MICSNKDVCCNSDSGILHSEVWNRPNPRFQGENTSLFKSMRTLGSPLLSHTSFLGLSHSAWQSSAHSRPSPMRLLTELWLPARGRNTVMISITESGQVFSCKPVHQNVATTYINETASFLSFICDFFKAWSIFLLIYFNLEKRGNLSSIQWFISLMHITGGAGLGKSPELGTQSRSPTQMAVTQAIKSSSAASLSGCTIAGNWIRGRGAKTWIRHSIMGCKHHQVTS